LRNDTGEREANARSTVKPLRSVAGSKGIAEMRGEVVAVEG